MSLLIAVSLSNEVERVTVAVAISNLGVSEVEVPMRMFERDAARKFLKIVSNEVRLDPIEVEIVSGAAIELVELGEGGRLEFSLAAVKKRVGKSSVLLAFSGASYLLDVGAIYGVSFSWGQSVSNQVPLVL